MQNYTIFEKPQPAADRIDRAEALLFVKDGFSWGAALFAPIWLLLNRMWWSLLGYVIVAMALQVVGAALRIDQHWMAMAGLALNVLLGFEGNSLRRWELERKGWAFVGAVTGANLADCERRFFEAWLPGQPIIAPPASTLKDAAADRRGWGLSALLGSR